MDDERKPWDRLPGEKATWYGRFQVWLKQKNPRSLLAIYNAELARRGKKKSLTYPHSWHDAKQLYRWEERTAAFDQAEQLRIAEEWKAQRDQERRDELAYAELLRQKSISMLALPEVAEVVKRNRAGEEVDWLLIPEFRAFKAASDMLGQAKDHARLALEMPTSHREINLRNLSMEDLYALADRFRQQSSMAIGTESRGVGIETARSADPTPGPEDEA